MGEIKAMKEALKQKWTDIHLKAKVIKDTESTASSEKHTQKIPHIPHDMRGKFTTSDEKRDQIRTKFVEMF